MLSSNERSGIGADSKAFKVPGCKPPASRTVVDRAERRAPDVWPCAIAIGPALIAEPRRIGRPAEPRLEEWVVVAAEAEAARSQAFLGVVDAAAVIGSEILHERAADAVAAATTGAADIEAGLAAAVEPLSGVHVDRQRDQMARRLGRRPRQRRLRDSLRPHRLHDRFEDRQRDLAASLAVAERALALGVVIPHPDRDRDVVAEAHEPGVVEIVAGAGLAADKGRQPAQARGGAA